MKRIFALLPFLILLACDDGDEATTVDDAGPIQDARVLTDLISEDAAPQAQDSAVVVTPDVTVEEDAAVEEDAVVVEGDAVVVEGDAVVEEDAAVVEDASLIVEEDAAVELPPGELLGELAVDCAVPYVLDAAQVTDGGYMAMHFEHLIQQYCVMGNLNGVDLNGHPEKMFYGTHASDGTVSLQQISMSGMLAPQFSVRIDFAPDTAIAVDTPWGMDPDGDGVVAMLIEHKDLTQTCLRGVGTAGALTFNDIADLTAAEGGRFTVSGRFTVTRPSAEICGRFGGVECCVD